MVITAQKRFTAFIFIIFIFKLTNSRYPKRRNFKSFIFYAKKLHILHLPFLLLLQLSRTISNEREGQAKINISKRITTTQPVRKIRNLALRDMRGVGPARGQRVNTRAKPACPTLSIRERRIDYSKVNKTDIY